MSAGQNKNAKLEEAGGEWELQPFGQILKEPVRNGIYKPKEFHGRGVKIVNMGELFAYPRLHSVPMKRVFLSDSEKKRFMLSTGDLLFARRSLVAEGAGKCSIVLELDEPATYESSIIRARPDNNKIESLFLYYFFNSVFGLHCLDTIRRQVAVAGITGNDLARLEIPIPPLEEQRAIAHILGTLDDKIELNRRTNETLEAMAQALFKFWFVDFGPVRAKMEGRWRRGQSLPGLPAHLFDLFPDRLVDSELGEIPEGWEVKAIGELAEIVGGSTPDTTKNIYWEDGIHFWVTPKDLSNLNAPALLSTKHRITNSGLSQISSGLLPPGTVLLSSRAPIGYLAVTEIFAAINQGFIAMKPKPGISNLFLLLWAHSAHDKIVSRANGSTFLEINKTNFRTIPVEAPPESAMFKFDQLSRSLYEQIVQNLYESHALATIRDTLLPKLISGKLRVKDAEKIIGG